MFLLANGPKETTRRSFFKNLRDNYIAGRLEAATKKEERKILESKQAEKIRRRAVFERNIKTLVDGFSRRLKRGPGHIKLLVVGGVVLVIWLCHKGSIGCDNTKEKQILLMILDDPETLEAHRILQWNYLPPPQTPDRRHTRQHQ